MASIWSKFGNAVGRGIDKISNETQNQSIQEVTDERVSKVFDILSGAGIKKSHVPDNVLVFTSIAGGAGASTIAANVAVGLKKEGYTVLMVDANIVYPVQYNFLGYKIRNSGNDLVSFLAGKCSIGEAIQNDKGVSLLTASNRNLMDLVNSDKKDNIDVLLEAVSGLREMFDYIIFDVPNMLMLDLVNSSMYFADKIYLVWDENVECIQNIELLRKNMMLCGISYEQKIRIIFNKRTSVQYPRYVFDQLDLAVDIVLPFDVSVIEAGLNSTAYIEGGASYNENAREFIRGIGQLVSFVIDDSGANASAAGIKESNTSSDDDSILDIGSESDENKDSNEEDKDSNEEKFEQTITFNVDESSFKDEQK